MKKIDFAIKVDGLMWRGKAVKPVRNDGLTCALQHTAPIMICYTSVVWRGYIGARNYKGVVKESLPFLVTLSCHFDTHVPIVRPSTRSFRSLWRREEYPSSTSLS